MTTPAFHATPPMTLQRATEIAAAFDLRLLNDDFYANPYPVYDVLRSDQPVRQMPDGTNFCALSRPTSLATGAPLKLAKLAIPSCRKAR